MDKQLQDPNEGPAWSRPFGPIHLQPGEDPWHGVRGQPFDSPGHKRAINPGDERSVTVTRGHPSLAASASLLVQRADGNE